RPGRRIVPGTHPNLWTPRHSLGRDRHDVLERQRLSQWHVRPLTDRRVQDLASFRLPADFRGRSGVVVQLWWLVQATLFRWSPQLLYGFRRWLLLYLGAQIGAGVCIRPSVNIPYPWKLQIGDYSWIGDDAVLYTFAKITIGKNA